MAHQWRCAAVLVCTMPAYRGTESSNVSVQLQCRAQPGTSMSPRFWCRPLSPHHETSTGSRGCSFRLLRARGITSRFGNVAPLVLEVERRARRVKRNTRNAPAGQKDRSPLAAIFLEASSQSLHLWVGPRHASPAVDLLPEMSAKMLRQRLGSLGSVF